MKDMGDVVILTREEYNELLADSNKLSKLEAHGVDNWSGYGDAMCSDDDEEEELI